MEFELSFLLISNQCLVEKNCGNNLVNTEPSNKEQTIENNYYKYIYFFRYSISIYTVNIYETNMDGLRIPQNPAWFMHSGCVCTPDNGFLYITGNKYGIGYISEIKNEAPEVKIIYSNFG